MEVTRIERSICENRAKTKIHQEGGQVHTIFAQDDVILSQAHIGIHQLGHARIG